MITRTFTFLAVILLLGLAAWQLGRAGMMAGKAWTAPILIGLAWDESEEEGTPVFPWPWADSYPTARLDVPDLGITRFVLAGDNMRNLAFGPVLAEYTSAQVLFGHRDTHFRFIENLVQGQELIFQRSGEEAARWRVAHNQVISVDNLAIPAEDQDLLLLVTCYPFDAIDPVTDLRYVVWLDQI